MGRPQPQSERNNEDPIDLHSDSPPVRPPVVRLNRGEAHQQLREVQDFILERNPGGRLQILQVGLSYKQRPSDRPPK